MNGIECEIKSPKPESEFIAPMQCEIMPIQRVDLKQERKWLKLIGEYQGDI